MLSALHRPAATLGLAAVLGASSVGCSAPLVDGPESVDGGEETTQGVVWIERLDSAEAGAQTNVSAKFLRVSGGADLERAERLVGTQLSLPALGTCEPVSVGEGEGLDALDGTIELLDVGDVTLSAGAQRLALTARAFPDVGDLVSGVFYTSPDAASELPAPARYVLEGSGGAGHEALEPFSLAADAPEPPAGVTLGGEPLGEWVHVRSSERTVELRWRADTAVRADLVYVELASREGAAVRCAFADEGGARLPVSADLVSVALHRVRLVELPVSAAPGAQVVEVRFDFGAVGRVAIDR